MPPLHLAVDVHDLGLEQRGIGTYAQALLARFARRDDIRLTLLVRDALPFRRAPALRAALGAQARVRCTNRVPRDADVVWHPWNGTFFAAAAPAVATIHDVVPFALPAGDARLRESQQAPFRRTAARAHTIVCDSAFTAADVTRYLGVASERLAVVPLGVDAAFSPGGLDALPPVLHGRRYVLYVGAHDAHKNVATLALAHRRAFPNGDMALVFTRPNPAVPEAIVCAGVSLDALVALYRGAAIVAVPSLHEGFGLPLLEAMACAAPVLAARAGALPEAGGDAVAYVDVPRDAAAWTSALTALAGNDRSRAELARAGPVRAADFPWERCAHSTLAILRAAT